MNLLTKILSSTLTLIFALIGGIVTGYAFLIGQMEARDEKVVVAMRIERTAQIGVLEAKVDSIKEDTSAMKLILMQNKGNK